MYHRIVLPAAAAELTSAPKHYVALGDSYASGPAIPEQQADPIGCQRSTHNYPALLAQALRIRDYTDVSCGGARTDDTTAPQPVRPGPNPAQFDALRPDTDLVTLTIGGNDINIGGLWLICAQLGPTDPSGDPCKREATAGGTDLYAQRIAAAAAPKVAQALAGIRARSPRATVLLVGLSAAPAPRNRVLSEVSYRPRRRPIRRRGWNSSSPPCWLTRPTTMARCSSTPTRVHSAATPASSRA